MNGDGDISLEEFLRATAGFTKMDPKTLFGRLDKNGREIKIFEIPLFPEFIFYCNLYTCKLCWFVPDDQVIDIEEFTHVDPSLGGVGIVDHCLRRRCWVVCIDIHIGWNWNILMHVSWKYNCTKTFYSSFLFINCG